MKQWCRQENFYLLLTGLLNLLGKLAQNSATLARYQFHKLSIGCTQSPVMQKSLDEVKKMAVWARIRN